MRQEDLCRPKYRVYKRGPRKHVCPMCRRRVILRMTYDEYEQVFYSMPPHKPRDWYKQKSL